MLAKLKADLQNQTSGIEAPPTDTENDSDKEKPGPDTGTGLPTLTSDPTALTPDIEFDSPSKARVVVGSVKYEIDLSQCESFSDKAKDADPKNMIFDPHVHKDQGGDGIPLVKPVFLGENDPEGSDYSNGGSPYDGVNAMMGNASLLTPLTNGWSPQSAADTAVNGHSNVQYSYIKQLQALASGIRYRTHCSDSGGQVTQMFGHGDNPDMSPPVTMATSTASLYPSYSPYSSISATSAGHPAPCQTACPCTTSLTVTPSENTNTTPYTTDVTMVTSQPMETSADGPNDSMLLRLLKKGPPPHCDGQSQPSYSIGSQPHAVTTVNGMMATSGSLRVAADTTTGRW